MKMTRSTLIAVVAGFTFLSTSSHGFSPLASSTRTTRPSTSSASSSSSWQLYAQKNKPGWMDYAASTLGDSNKEPSSTTALYAGGGGGGESSTNTMSSSSSRQGNYTNFSSKTPFDDINRIQESTMNNRDDFIEGILSSYLGPRIILVVLAAVYATNFPLGALMNDVLPASAATSSRMLVAALALAPFIPRLSPSLRIPAVTCGCFTALGYIAQSLALLDTDPARVSFLGAATVLWCPILEAVFDKKDMSLQAAPQTWLAALLCMAGVGVLELDPLAVVDAAAASTSGISVSSGDLLALLQAVGFGTGVFWTSRMLRKEPDQALPVTATLVATTAALAAVWSLADGWMWQEGWQHLTLPGLFMDESMRNVAGAVLWTGLISTSLNFFIELTALGRVPPSEASVILASEPLWAALFAAAFYGTALTSADSVGGALIVSACLANALLSPASFQKVFSVFDNKSR
jgi:drug/metabolite transporter (DMT)-like permease